MNRGPTYKMLNDPAYLATRRCGCGHQGVIKRTGSGYVCAECDRLQKIYTTQRARRCVGMEEPQGYPSQKTWELDLTPIGGASLRWLEQRLQRIAA